MSALFFVLDLVARLSSIAALLAITRDAKAAAAIAFVSAVAAVLRALVYGEAYAREVERSWIEIVAGIRERDVSALQAYKNEEEGVTTLVDAVHEVSLFRASSVPSLLAQGASVVAVLAVIVVRLPLVWVAGGLALAVPLALAVRSAQRVQFRSQMRAYGAHADLARDARALVEGCVELRAHGRESAFADQMTDRATRMARSERSSIRLSAAVGVAPTALTLLALALPTGVLAALTARVGLVDLAVIGGAALANGFGLVRSIEAVRRAAPYRAAFDRIARKPKLHPQVMSSGTKLPSIAFDGLSVVHPGARYATPHRFHLALDGQGVLLAGTNGSGKTTAILALLGFVTPSRGTVAIDGAPLASEGAEMLRASVSFLPQRPFVSVGDTLGWHAALLGVDQTSLGEWLDKMGLSQPLEARAAPGNVLDLTLGSLSGGERQRFFLARAFARRSHLLILDEPEAGLDSRGRDRLREILEEVAKERQVLVVAHDEGMCPPGFRRAECHAEATALEDDSSATTA